MNTTNMRATLARVRRDPIVWGWTRGIGWQIIGTGRECLRQAAGRYSDLRTLPWGRVPAPSAEPEWKRWAAISGSESHA